MKKKFILCVVKSFSPSRRARMYLLAGSPQFPFNCHETKWSNVCHQHANFCLFWAALFKTNFVSYKKNFDSTVACSIANFWESFAIKKEFSLSLKLPNSVQICTILLLSITWGGLNTSRMSFEYKTFKVENTSTQTLSFNFSILQPTTILESGVHYDGSFLAQIPHLKTAIL